MYNKSVEESIAVSGNMVECPFCKNKIEAKVFFCPICGKKVREKPVSTKFWPVLWLFFLTILLPPLNIGLTIKYMKSADAKAKRIGLISLIVMIAVLVVAVVSTFYVTKYVSDQVNQQVGQQLKQYQNYGY
jgi:hypothetical protein